MSHDELREKLRTLNLCGGVTVPAYIPVPPELRDALVSALTPPTCGTCRYWQQVTNQSGICGLNVRFDEGRTTPYNFGCTLHQPLAGADTETR